jgi:hypothetical protein
MGQWRVEEVQLARTLAFLILILIASHRAPRLLLPCTIVGKNGRRCRCRPTAAASRSGRMYPSGVSVEDGDAEGRVATSLWMSNWSIALVLLLRQRPGGQGEGRLTKIKDGMCEALTGTYHRRTASRSLNALANVCPIRSMYRCGTWEVAMSSVSLCSIRSSTAFTKNKLNQHKINGAFFWILLLCSVLSRSARCFALTALSSAGRVCEQSHSRKTDDPASTFNLFQRKECKQPSYSQYLARHGHTGGTKIPDW